MCMGNTPRDQHKELWFYVPDYPAVHRRLEFAYRYFSVEEHAAEPGRVGGCQNDADVHVHGNDRTIARFWNWLHTANIPGLMIEGKEIGPRHYPEGKPL